MSQNNKQHLLICAIFCTVIIVPLVLAPFGSHFNTEVLSNENRQRAKWPTLNKTDFKLTQYTSQIDQYLEDHFPFRATLLQRYASLRHTLLKTGTGSASIGKNGWLYFSSGKNLLNASGADPFTTTEANDWIETALTIKNTVEAYGGKFAIVIAPDKAQVYPEFLPKRINYQRQGRRADTLKALAVKNGIIYIDLLEHLLAHKDKHQLYYKTDTHWTHQGAFIGYQKVIQSLNTHGFNLPSAQDTQFVKQEDQDFTGDLARMLHLEPQFPESRTRLTPKSPPTHDKNESLLILGDSFSGNTRLYWPFSFNQYECMHHNWGEINLDYVKQKKANTVILMMVERGLQHQLTTNSQQKTNCNLQQIN